MRGRGKDFVRPLVIAVVGGGLALLALAPQQNHVASAAAASSAPQVFQDSLANDWSDYSWDTNRNLKFRGKQRLGAASIKAKYKDAWGGLSFHSDTGVDPGVYRVLHFRLRASVENQDFVLVVRDAQDRDQGRDYHLPVSPSRDGFTTYDIPLSVFGRNLPRLHRFVIEDGSGDPPRKWFWVDDVRFTTG